MTTMQEQWRQYRDKVYPFDIPAQQNVECHQAFFAGAFVMMQAMEEIAAKLPEGKAMIELQRLKNELVSILSERVGNFRARN